MGVEVIVRGTTKICRDDVAEKKCPNIVLDCVRFVFVERHKDEGLIHEGGVIEEGSQERSGPVTGIIDSGIVAVMQHVGSEKRPESMLASPLGIDTIEEEF